MPIEDFYFADPRTVLIPVEHLTPMGISAPFAALLRQRADWELARVELFNQGFRLYWQRATALARRTRTWQLPRIRHVAVVKRPEAIHPYVQLLNTSSWMLYEDDLAPVGSNAEFVAYLLVHGDRMAITGEITAAALHNAAYWFDRSDEERATFAAAAARSLRPDAGAFRALAESTAWLRQLAHDTLQPPAGIGRFRRIPGTDLLVRSDGEAQPAALVNRWRAVAESTLRSFHSTWQASDPNAVAGLCDWLAQSAPALLICGKSNRLLWDPEQPHRLGALRTLLRNASGAAVRDILADLQVVSARTQAFHASLVDPGGLPAPDPHTEQSGYVYLHIDRRLITYNLYEPGIERLRGPAIPYARAMLGARTVHEWCHLAAAAGWVPEQRSTPSHAERIGALAGELAGVLDAAPPAVRAVSQRDLQELIATHTSYPHRTEQGFVHAAGTALAAVLVSRMPDYQANLLGQRFMTPLERETYVRHNIRMLRSTYSAAAVWRLLVRYLYEFQYLRFSAVPDPQTFFLASCGFEADFFGSGILSREQFHRLVTAVTAVCDNYAVDERYFRSAPPKA